MSKVGRPRQASHELLQEAAFELFQLHGYRATSVEQIARTAGFSRATFFNFFSSKAELFWVETDHLLAGLRDALDARLQESGPPSLHQALLAHAHSLQSSDIPWALKNYRLLEAADDLVASGASRVLELNRVFARYLRQVEQLASEPRPAIDTASQAAVTTALLLTALLTWIDAGVNRGSLHSHLQRAFSHAL